MISRTGQWSLFIFFIGLIAATAVLSQAANSASSFIKICNNLDENTTIAVDFEVADEIFTGDYCLWDILIPRGQSVQTTFLPHKACYGSSLVAHISDANTGASLIVVPTSLPGKNVFLAGTNYGVTIVGSKQQGYGFRNGCDF